MAASLTVFVCSTFSDLSAERDAVLDAIRRLQLKHDSMEFFGARAAQPIETCLEEVRRSDVLVVIVGHRYGSLVPKLGISYSEAEYAEGHRLRKPCLVYIRDDSVPILPKHMERDAAKLALLEKWKAVLRDRHTVASFKDGPGLAVQVAADLGRTIQELEETAKARAAVRPKGHKALSDEVSKLVSDAIQAGASEASVLTVLRHSLAMLMPQKATKHPSVFLSYARADRKTVTAVSRGLREAGLKVWLDEQNIQTGENWVAEIERALSATDFIIFFISPESVRSGWAKKELDVALLTQISGESGAVIIPVLLADADVPPLLRQFQWLDMRDGNIEKAVARLVEDIHHWWVRREF